MLPIPNNILTKFEAILEKRRVAVEKRFEFKNGSDIFWTFVLNTRFRIPGAFVHRKIVR